MKTASYISTHIIYPNQVVTPEYLKGVPGFILNNKKVNADVTFESEFIGLSNPKQSVFKLSKKKWIDSFFETGQLQLGTLNLYRSISNKEKGDSKEGSLIIVGQGEAYTAFTEITSGFNNYLFCCSLERPKKETLKNFEYDDYFEIENVEAFSNAISNVIKSNRSAMSKCIYKKDKVLIGKTPIGFDFNTISTRLKDMVNQTKYFIKPIEYQNQKEFRFIWELDYDVDEAIIINCPEAIKYCRR